MMSAKKYFLSILIIGLAASAAVIVFNWLVDPLDIYRVVKAEGFNAYKTTYKSYARVAKPLQIEKHHYQRLALGSSRTEIGIPIYGTAWDRWGDPGFNGALNGANVDTLYAMLHHAVQVSNLRDVLIGLDFGMFNGEQIQGFEYEELLANGPGHWAKLKRWLRGMALTLFSPATTAASVKTLRHQSAMDHKYHDTGQQNNEREILKNAALGYRIRFEHFENASIRNYWTPCRDNGFRYKNGRGHDALAVFRNILMLAQGRSFSIHLFISPVHARLLETLSAGGLWPAFEQWKRDITAVVDDVRAQTGLDIQLWDFSGYHHFAVEPLPEKGQLMKYFLDGSHYTDTVGRVILDTIYGGAKPEGSFGVRLTPATIEAHLQDIRRKQEAYRQAHLEQYDDIQARAQAFIEKRRQTGQICPGPPIAQPGSTYGAG
jgi:hypothetical protein